MRARVIPCLSLKNGGLVKTTRFRDPAYVGDPINAMRIFNDRQADEVFLLDIAATVSGRGPDFEAIEQIVAEAFVPIGYGGGIANVEQAARIPRNRRRKNRGEFGRSRRAGFDVASRTAFRLAGGGGVDRCQVKAARRAGGRGAVRASGHGP